LKKSLLHESFSGNLSIMARDPDVRWRQRFENFKQALAQLLSAAALSRQRELSKLEQQGLIQAFEFTHELAWNTLKDFLESRGAINLYGSKDATREAFAKGLIEDGDQWMAMIQSRNRTTHTYNEETADEIAKAILSHYVPEFEQFLRKFTEMEKDER
jgi:nucleotidyltransferase substrate binding protein (TIGR01987 family)